MGLLLNPDVKLRPDGGRAILFSINGPESMSEPAFCFLYPQEAIMLTLFDGHQTRNEIDRAVAYLFDLDTTAAHCRVENLLEVPINAGDSIRSLMIETSHSTHRDTRTYDPHAFVVPVEQVDMSNVRCMMPVTLLVLPTMRCLTRCVYCYADRGGVQTNREFTVKLYERLLVEAQQCGIETIEFSGGDLFCRRDAFDLIECTLSHGLYPVIPTKYPLSFEQTKRLAGMGLNTIQVSIDSIRPELIEKMVGIAHYGQRILNTINYLGEAGIQVRTNSVLTPFNVADAGNLARYLAELPHVFKSHYTCYSRSLYSHGDALFCSKAEVERFEMELALIKESFPKKGIFFSGLLPDPYDDSGHQRASSFRNRAMCTANRRGVVVLPDGKVTICEELYFHRDFIIGDLNTQSLLEVWNSSKAFELARPDRAKVPDGACRDCVDFTSCNEGRGRCFRDALKAYGMNRPHWPDPRCPRAPVGNRLA